MPLLLPTVSRTITLCFLLVGATLPLWKLGVVASPGKAFFDEKQEDAGNGSTDRLLRRPKSSGECKCNGNTERPAAGIPPLDISSKELTYPNIGLEVAYIGLSLIPGTGGEAHKDAMVGACLYEAYAVLTDGIDPLSAKGQEIKDSMEPGMSEEEMEEYIGYAGYGALKRILEDAPENVALLDAKMEALGFDSKKVMDHPSAPFVMDIHAKYKLTPPPGGFTPTNPPSKTFDADCEGLVDLNHWQGQCVQGKPGEDCKPQQASSSFFDGPLISSDGERNVKELIADVPPPPSYTEKGNNDEFFAQHRAVLEASATLGDVEKFAAEYFEINSAVQMGYLTLNEAEARGLSLGDSIILYFAVAGAERDAAVGSTTTKLTYESVRPITVLQCQFRGEKIKAWSGPYYGVQEFKNGGGEEDCSGNNPHLWRSYQQTPRSPGYTSSAAGAAAAAATVLTLFFTDGKLMGNNCAIRKMGMDRLEPRILKGGIGYIAGVTDCPNEGPDTIGFAPASDVTLCWETYGDFANKLAESRVLAGIHIPADNNSGLAWGEKIAGIFYEFLMDKINSAP